MKRGTKWFILVGSFVIYLFDALEIAVLSFALPAISKELALTPLAGGLLATATLLGMGCSSVITGWLADNRGRRVALIVSMAVFVALTSALFVVPNYGIFVALRFLAGIGLGGVWSVLSTYIVETWPAQQRGRAVAFVLAAYPLGGAGAALIAGVFMPDWRTLFLVTGLSALLPLLMVVFFFPESKAWLEERAGQQASTVTVKEVFTGSYRRRTIFATLVAVCAFVGFYGASTWMPSYLATERGLDPRQVSLFMTILNLGMFAGYIVFGWIADRIGRRNAIMLSLAGTGLLMPLYGLVTNQAVLLWMGPLYAFFMTFAGLFGSYLGELYPTRIRTTGAGFCFNIGRGVAAFAPLAMGGIAATWGFSSGLILSGAVFLAGGALMLFLPTPTAAPPRTIRQSSPTFRKNPSTMPDLIDLSVSLRGGIASDPPGMTPEIEYFTHRETAKDLVSYFPGMNEADLPGEEGWAIERINATTHTGTHLDAPYHYASIMDGGARAITIDEVPLEWCFGRGVKLDFRHFEDGYVATADDVEAELSRVGHQLEPGDIVVVNTAAGARYGFDDYLSRGCGMGREATLYLTSRGVRVTGTDAWSWDAPFIHTAKRYVETGDNSLIWEGHKAGMEIGYCHIEKLHNLEALPATGFRISCFPVKIHGASAGWTRAVAILDTEAGK